METIIGAAVKRQPALSLRGSFEFPHGPKDLRLVSALDLIKPLGPRPVKRLAIAAVQAWRAAEVDDESLERLDAPTGRLLPEGLGEPRVFLQVDGDVVRGRTGRVFLMSSSKVAYPSAFRIFSPTSIPPSPRAVIL
jgi:hypothetical protein